MTERVRATPSLVEKLSKYNKAKAAAARWAQEQDDLKAMILEELGYDPEDPKPVPVIVEDETGREVFSTKVGTWRGLNQKAFKTNRPDVYALYETSKATLTIKYPKD